MKNISTSKEKLRKEIASIKGKHSQEELTILSQEVLATLEVTDVFQNAKIIFIYNSLKDEVQTRSLIEKWKMEKTFYFPAIDNNNLQFRKYTSDNSMNKSLLGIYEPEGDNFTDYKKVDLIIVPGVAFDRKMNRLGRGKGYYDRFLPKLSSPKAGICFEFQLRDQIPSEANDVKMDYIISENEIIW